MIPDSLLSQFKAVFATMALKDWGALLISSAALFLSWYSRRDKKVEGRFSLRKQLNELLEKITDINTEIAKFGALRDKSAYPVHYSGLLNDQRRFFARQAEYVALQIPDLVSPYECTLIAEAFAQMEEIESAAIWFERALTSAKGFDSPRVRRSYAKFLAAQGDLESAREQLESALKQVSGSSDREVSFRANTYERIGVLEREWKNQERSNAALDCALNEYEQLRHPKRREFEVKRIQELRTKAAAAGSASVR